MSRRAAAWWPAVVGLEQVMDAVTATALVVSRSVPSPGESGGSSSPANTAPPAGVKQLCAALRAVSEAAEEGTALQTPGDLPDDEVLKPITEAIRARLGVLDNGQRLRVLG